MKHFHPDAASQFGNGANKVTGGAECLMVFDQVSQHLVEDGDIGAEAVIAVRQIITEPECFAMLLVWVTVLLKVNDDMRRLVLEEDDDSLDDLVH